MLTNILHLWNDILKLKGGEKIYPSFVDFHTSNTCNQKCQGCAYEATMTKDCMPEEKHFLAADLFMTQGCKAFDFAGGGEPTVLPYLPKLMHYIGDRGANFALITNGTLLRDPLVDALLKHGTYIRVSLEASCKANYVRHKKARAEMWDHVITSIRHIVAERNRLGSKLEVSLKFLVTKFDKGEKHYRDAIELGWKLGVDRVNIKAIRHDPYELPFTERLWESIICRQVVHDLGADKFVHHWIAPLPFSEVPQCWLTPLHAMMDYAGDVYICCYHYWRQKDHFIGNIFRDSFEDIWLAEDHRRKLAAIERKECAKVDCKFFNHHLAVNHALNRGHVGFL